MTAPRYSQIKRQETAQRRTGVKQRGSRSALSQQRRVSLVGHGKSWQITNLRQVSAAMAKWA